MQTLRIEEMHGWWGNPLQERFWCIMSKSTRGREIGTETLAIRDLFEKQGDMNYKTALPHIQALPKAVREHFTEVSEDGKKSGANRYNVAKNAWKHSKGMLVKVRKPKTEKTEKTEKTVKSVKSKTMIGDFNTDAVTEVARLGGITAVKTEISRLQGLVTAAEVFVGKVA